MRALQMVFVSGVVLAALSCADNKLTSIAVTPSVADAQSFPGGMVQFTATGVYSGSSKMTGVSNVTWCIGTSSGQCNGNIAAAATIDNNGRAQCVSNQTGTVTVLAGTGGQVATPDGGAQLKVFGTATLTCP